MADATATTRRSLFAGGIGLATLAALPAAAATPHAALYAELAAVQRITDRINSDAPFDHALYETWCERGNKLYRAIEALPAIPSSVDLKLKCIYQIQEDEDIEGAVGSATTTERLAGQILRALAGAH